MQDDDLYLETFDLLQIPQQTADFAGYICLIDGKTNALKNLAPFMTLSNPPRAIQFLKEAVRENQREILQFIITSARLDPNYAIMVLIEENCPWAIRILLQNCTVALHARQEWAPIGLFSAIKEAAYRNFKESLQAIFEELSGDAIPLEILINIRNLFTNYSPDFALQHYDWVMLKDHPDKEGMIQLFNEQITIRQDPIDNFLLSELSFTS